MELTVSRLLLVALPVVALCLVGGVPTTSDAQRIVSFPSAAGYKTTSRDRARDPFPRREELMQALDFLEAYERGINENDWNRDQDVDGGFLYGDEADGDALDIGNTLNFEDPLDFEDTNEIYPEDLDLDFRQETEGFPEKLSTEDNTVDIPPWLVNYLLREGQGNEEEYSPKEEEPKDLPWGVDDQEFLEELLEEEEAEEETEAEAEEETYRKEMEREEEEAIADIVEQEMEDMVVNDILDDIRGQEVLQEDAEENLKWLLIEEEERFQREEEKEEEEDPFQFEFSSSEADIYPAAEPGGDSAMESIGESLLLDYGHGGEYWMVGGSEEAADLEGESLDEAEKDELMEEAAEILDLQDMEEEERRNELWDRRAFEGASLTKEEIREGAAEEDEEQEEFDEEEEQPSSMLNAGMGDVGSEEDVQQEVYNELAEFLEIEIDQAIENLADDILEELDEEAKGEIEGEGEGEGVGGEAIDEDGEWNGEGAASTDEGSQNVTPEGSEDEEEGCSSLQYFIDDCNIVNNYGDLGADGYKDLFAGACNRHQLCYACGEYYDVGGQLCDELYKAEMLALCDLDDTGCKQRAKYFWLVARNNRVPEGESSPICADRCVLNYMIEVFKYTPCDDFAVFAQAELLKGITGDE